MTFFFAFQFLGGGGGPGPLGPPPWTRAWYNNSQLIHDWNLTSDRLKNLHSVLSDLIGIRDGYKTCDGLTCDDINAFILDLCTN